MGGDIVLLLLYKDLSDRWRVNMRNWETLWEGAIVIQASGKKGVNLSGDGRDKDEPLVPERCRRGNRLDW